MEGKVKGVLISSNIETAQTAGSFSQEQTWRKKEKEENKSY